MFDVGYFPPNTPPDGMSRRRSYTPDNGLEGGRPAWPRWADFVAEVG